MPTIMTQTHGGKTRRCDGACHNAKHANCHCICGGRYHGAGRDAQDRLTRDWLGNDWEEKKAAIEAQGGTFVGVISDALKWLGATVTPKAVL